jgi:hypothetical protein
MKKEIVLIILIGLPIINIANPILASNITDGEIIDQSQTNHGTSCIIWNHYLAQSFKPSMSPLTKVDLALWWGYPQPNIDMIVTIRESLQGEDLITTRISGDELTGEFGWVTFDIEDLEVSINKKYYIIFYLDPLIPDAEDKIYWSFGWVEGLIQGCINDPYRGGRLYMKNNDFLGGLWHRAYAPWQGQFDFCFKTYTYG